MVEFEHSLRNQIEQIDFQNLKDQREIERVKLILRIMMQEALGQRDRLPTEAEEALKRLAIFTDVRGFLNYVVDLNLGPATSLQRVMAYVGFLRISGHAEILRDTDGNKRPIIILRKIDKSTLGHELDHLSTRLLGNTPEHLARDMNNLVLRANLGILTAISSLVGATGLHLARGGNIASETVGLLAVAGFSTLQAIASDLAYRFHPSERKAVKASRDFG